MMKELTKAEEQIMQALWSVEKGFVSDIIEALPGPRPAYSTVATMIRILENKGFIAHRTYGKNHEYYPLIAKSDYAGRFIQKFTKNYFDNSFSGLISSFAGHGKLSLYELEELKKFIDNEIEKQK